MTSVPTRKILYLLILLCTAAVNSQTEEEVTQNDEKEISQDDKIQCVKKFVEWCNGMLYPQESGNGLALMSISYRDNSNHYRVFCSSDSEGTNCSRNGSPWFSCSPDHVLTYKGDVLTESTTNVDNEICKTQEKAFKELFVQNMSYDNSTMSVIEKELKSFFTEMLEIRHQMLELHKRLGLWDDFGDFPIQPDEDSETVEPSKKTDSNQIEKE